MDTLLQTENLQPKESENLVNFLGLKSAQKLTTFYR